MSDVFEYMNTFKPFVTSTVKHMLEKFWRLYSSSSLALESLKDMELV